MPNCTCERCVNACKRYPGWMTVEEAKAAIAAGLGDKLALDYWCDDPYVYVLLPAQVGMEGRTMATFPAPEPCIFLQDDRCSIHNSGFKPLQCRDTFCCEDKGSLKEDFLQYWNTDEGRELVEQWSTAYGQEG